MREILFRGKDKFGGWHFGFYTEGYYLDGTPVSWIEEVDRKKKQTESPTVIPETVGQYTGLTDKNGKKVFEGDILVFCKGATYPYKVIWDGMGWKLIRSDGKRIKEAFECNEMHYVNISEVIGNIHDNPELLEV